MQALNSQFLQYSEDVLRDTGKGNGFIDASKTITTAFLNYAPEQIFVSSFQNFCLLYAFMSNFDRA